MRKYLILFLLLVMALGCEPPTNNDVTYIKGTIVAFDHETVTVAREARFGHHGMVVNWEYPYSIDFQLYDDIRGVWGDDDDIINFVIIPVERYE